jgi:hypothetical protein
MLTAFESPSTLSVTTGVSTPVCVKFTTFKSLTALAPIVILLTADAESAPTATLLLSPVIATLVVVELAEISVAQDALATPDANVVIDPHSVTSLLSPVTAVVNVVSDAALISTSKMLVLPVAV